MSHATAASVNPEEAIPELMDAYGDRIYGLALHLCGEPSAADDLVQETFLRAYRNWPRFEGRSAPLTWLYTIASRACQRLERRRAGQPRRVETLDELVAAHATPSELVGTQEDPLEYTMRREETGRLRAAIAALPSPFRLPLVLKELQGLSVLEVADVLGLQEGTVKTRLHRARLTLRKELGPGSRVEPADDDTHEARHCSDLLVAKLEALSRGVPFPIDNDGLCARCRTALGDLDRIQELCEEMPTDPLPLELRASVLRTLTDFERTG